MISCLRTTLSNSRGSSLLNRNLRSISTAIFCLFQFFFCLCESRNIVVERLLVAEREDASCLDVAVNPHVLGEFELCLNFAEDDANTVDAHQPVISVLSSLLKIVSSTEVYEFVGSQLPVDS